MLFINNITIKLGIKQKHSIHKQGYPTQKMSLYPKSRELKIPIKETPIHIHPNPQEKRDLQEIMENLISWYFSEDSKNPPSDYFLTRQNAIKAGSKAGCKDPIELGL